MLPSLESLNAEEPDSDNEAFKAELDFWPPDLSVPEEGASTSELREVECYWIDSVLPTNLIFLVGIEEASTYNKRARC